MTLELPGNPLKPVEIDRIIIHHSATADSETLSWNAMRRWHTEVWSPPADDIGYHAGIEVIRDGYEVVIGRPITRTGAHTAGQNSRSLGFCFVGNFDESPPMRHMLEVAAVRWLVPTLQLLGLDQASLVPHRDFADKTCPGRQFDMDELKAVVKGYLDAPA